MQVTPCYPNIWNWLPYPRILGLFTYRFHAAKILADPVAFQRVHFSEGGKGLGTMERNPTSYGVPLVVDPRKVPRGTNAFQSNSCLTWITWMIWDTSILDPVCSMVPEYVAELGRFWLNVGKCSEPWSIGEQSHTQQELEQLLKMIGSMVPLPK